MGATIEGISVVFNASGLDTIGAGIATTDSTLAGLGATADVVGTSLAGMADRALASGASMDSLAASVSADGEAFLSLTDVMAQLNSVASEQTLAITSDGEAMVTLGSVMADLDAFSAQTAASMQAEADAAAYLAMMGEAAAPALAETAAASEAASTALDTTAASADTAAVSMDTLKGAAMGIAVIAAGLGLVGVATTKMAGDFQSSITTLHTGAGELSSNLGMVSQGILNLATQTGESTKQLSDGMYLVESAGYHGAAGLQVLQAAAEGAKVGNADLATVANGVTTVMTDYASKNITAAQATNDLIATVAAGKTTMADLSQAMSSILPTSSAAHVGLSDVSGAMATMTGEGVPAADAATYLRQMLMSLDNPSKQAKDALASIGLTSSQVASDMQKSLPDTLKMIEDHLAQKFPVGSSQYMAALASISGGTKQMQGMLDLTGSHLSTFEGNVSSISAAVKKGGANIQGWSDVQKDFNFKMDQAKSSLEVLGITIGSKLLPAIGPLVSNVANAVSGFTAWLNSGHALGDALSLTGKYSQTALPILAGLGALVLAILVPAFWSWASATIAATWPILAVVAAVMAVVAIFVLLYQHVAPFRAFIDNLVNGFKMIAGYINANFGPAMKQVGAFMQANIMPILGQIGSFLASTFQPLWQQLVQLWNGQLMPLLKQLWGTFQQLMPAFQAIGAIVGVVLIGAFANLMGVIGGLIKGFAGFMSGMMVVVKGVAQMFSGLIQIFSGIGNLIRDVFTGNFKNIGNDIKQIFSGVQTYFSGLGTAMKGWFQAIFGGITGFISGWIGGFMGTIGSIVGIVQKTRIQAEQQQTEMKLHAINTAMSQATEVLKHADAQRQGILKELENTKDPAKRHALEMKLAAIAAKEEEAKKVIDAEKKKKEEVLKHLAELKRQEEEANKSIFQKTADWFGQARDKAIQLFQNMRDGVMHRFTDLRNSVGNWFSSFGSFWHDRWTGIVNAVGNIFSSIGGAVKAAFNHVIDLINNVIKSVDSINVAGFGVNIPLIPYLASGGIVAPGGLAIVGERGPEIIQGGTSGVSVLGTSQTAALLGSSRGGGFSSGGGQKVTVVVPLMLNGREIARATIDDLQELVLSGARSSGHPVGGW